MNTNTNAILNRAEVFFYSTLIACMSGVNRIRTHLARKSILPNPSTPYVESNVVPVGAEVTAEAPTNSWKNLSQSLAALAMWIILGFAAGFLIGMINPR